MANEFMTAPRIHALCVQLLLLVALCLANGNHSKTEGFEASSGNRCCQSLCTSTPSIPGIPGIPGSPGSVGPAGAPGSPGIQGPPGPMGLRGTDGNEGPRGRQGLTGRDGKPGPRGLTGSAGSKGANGSSGPKGNKGEAGAQGHQGPPGPQVADGASLRNWKQCVYKNINEGKDTGQIKECLFNKSYANTGLRVFFNGVLCIYNCHACCRRWYFTFNGAECAAPAAIDGVVYMRNGNNAKKDLHRVRQIEGVCEEVNKGIVRVGFWVGNCVGYGTADAYTGWNSVSRIYVEEVPPPQA